MRHIIRISIFVLFLGMYKDVSAMQKWQIEPKRFVRNSETLRNIYSEIATKQWLPTTVIFMRNNPQASESQVLQRYLQEVVHMAYTYRMKEQPLEEIGDEVEMAISRTPANGVRLHYILTGMLLPEGEAYCILSCARAWNKELQQIERIIIGKKS